MLKDMLAPYFVLTEMVNLGKECNCFWMDARKERAILALKLA